MHTHTHTHTQQPLCTHFTLYTHMHTLIKGVLNQRQSPQRTPLLQAHLHLYTHTHTHAHTINITTATVFLRPPSAISQSQPPSSWNTCMQYYYSKILKYAHTHTHTTATMHTLHTLHSHAHTNQGCTEPGAESPTYTLATSSPIPLHTYTHICTHNKHYH